MTTAARHTVAIAILAVLAISTACGGRGGDTYAKATEAQTRCCEHLDGAARWRNPGRT